MEGNLKQENPEGDNFDILKRRLISGEVSCEDFINTVYELDQSDPERKSSLRASEILSLPEVEKIFLDSDAIESFYNARSLSFFHKAQIRLFNGETDVQCDLESSVADSIQVNDVNEEDWINYVKATIAYLNNDIGTVRGLVAHITANHALVENFIQGLEERGFPDYVSDYSKERF